MHCQSMGDGGFEYSVGVMQRKLTPKSLLDLAVYTDHCRYNRQRSHAPDSHVLYILGPGDKSTGLAAHTGTKRSLPLITREAVPFQAIYSLAKPYACKLQGRPHWLSFGTACRREITPATLDKTLLRYCLVYSLAFLDVSEQWLMSHVDASPNEGSNCDFTILPRIANVKMGLRLTILLACHILATGPGRKPRRLGSV